MFGTKRSIKSSFIYTKCIGAGMTEIVQAHNLSAKRFKKSKYDSFMLFVFLQLIQKPTSCYIKKFNRLVSVKFSNK